MAGLSSQGSLFDRAAEPVPAAGNSAGAGVVVRETECKSVLVKSGIADYALNCYTGCTHACAYCYARFMQRFHPHPEPWGRFVDVKANAVPVLIRQLRRTRPGCVCVSSACDGWQPIEAERRLTRECCDLLLQAGFQVSILTKSALVLRDLDLLARRRARVGVTLTTLDEGQAALWEPGAAPVAERIGVLREAKAAGLPTAVMFGPVLPFLADGQESLDALFACAADLEVDTIWVDGMNLRSGVWPAVSALLRAHHPDLVQEYGRILHNTEVRQAYRRGLRQRAALAARRAGVSDLLAGCA